MPEEKKYEDLQDVIDEAVKKQSSRWRLNALRWIDYEDISQIIKSHIAEKWNMWDQTRPFSPWVNTLIRNQIWNQIRKHYGSYIKPCVHCEYARDNNCLFTLSGNQDTSCAEFAKWSKKKKNGLELKTASSLEDSKVQFSETPDNSFDYDLYFKRLDILMKEKLSEQHYTAYRMVFFEKSSEKDVAEFMGYKITNDGEKLGHRQVKNLKRRFADIAKEILKKEDLLENGFK